MSASPEDRLIELRLKASDGELSPEEREELRRLTHETGLAEEIDLGEDDDEPTGD